MNDLNMDEVHARTDEWLGQNELADATAEMVWLDLETTGLSATDDDMLEVGIFVTDRYGFIVKNGVRSWLVGGADASKMDDFVSKMHTASGLLEQLSKAGRNAMSAANLEVTLHDFIHSHFPDSKPPLAGSSVHFDRSFLAAKMPMVLDALLYRNIDISSNKEQARLHHPRLLEILHEEKSPMKAHRVVPDLIDTIEEYRFYLAEFLWTQDNVDGIAGKKA